MTNILANTFGLFPAPNSTDAHLMNGGVIFERLHDDVQLPERATANSAGYDLRAYLNVERVKFFRSLGESATVPPLGGGNAASGPKYLILQPFERALIPTGLKLRMPPQMYATLVPRSSMGVKMGMGMPHSLGIIDADYPDEWFVGVVNLNPDCALRITHGDRIAQVVFNLFCSPPFMEGTVNQTTDRAGGAGSTGTR